MKFYNVKRAEIGETFTWIVAFTIIFFVILLFFGAVVSIKTFNPLKPKPEISIGDVEKSYIDHDLSLTLLKFLKENNKIVSDWADDDFVLEHNKWVFGERDQKMETLCTKIKEVNSKLISRNYRIYLFNKVDEIEETIILENNGKEIICRTKPQNAVIVDYGQASRLKVFTGFLSENKKIVYVAYVENEI